MCSGFLASDVITWLLGQVDESCMRQPHVMPEGARMSTLVPLVILLLVLVCVLIFGGLVYVVYRHPTLGTPLTVAFGGLTLVATAVAAIVTR